MVINAMRILCCSVLMMICINTIAETKLSKIAPKDTSITGEWVLDKSNSDEPGKKFLNAWKDERRDSNHRNKRLRREAQFVDAMTTYLFPYADGIIIEQHKDGISINYNKGEFREYWVNEQNLPEFTGVYAEVFAGWQKNRFLIETVMEEDDMTVQEFFEIKQQGKQLINTIVIDWKELPQPVVVKRLYLKQDLPKLNEPTSAPVAHQTQ